MYTSPSVSWPNEEICRPVASAVPPQRQRRRGVARDAPEIAAAEIAEHVTAVQRGNRAAAIHEAAGGRDWPSERPYCATGAIGARVRTAGGVERVGAFEAAPAVVAAERHEVDFLERALADVVEPELAAAAIEAPAPRIAEAVREDLRAVGGAGAADVAARGWRRTDSTAGWCRWSSASSRQRRCAASCPTTSSGAGRCRWRRARRRRRRRRRCRCRGSRRGRRRCCRRCDCSPGRRR